MSVRDQLRAVPDVAIEPSDAVKRGIAHSLAYLDSDEAAASLERDAYWPKWHSPWWHFTALWECGEAHHASSRAVARMVAAIDRIRLHTFPTTLAEMEPLPAHTDLSCHCAVGTMDQVLAACGVDVPTALPWFTTWMREYQMKDGGYNCDERAYLEPVDEHGECPSSMTGTIAIFEALLARPDRTLERAGEFLLARELWRGSPTKQNEHERTLEPLWLRPAFPRFYFYDVLRGLDAVSRWQHAIPDAAIAHVVEHLVRTFPDGIIRVQRHPYDAHGTWAFVEGEWSRQPATRFPLLDALSIKNAPHSYLTAEWRATRERLLQR